MEGMDECDDDDENGRSVEVEAAGGANGSVVASTSPPLSQPPFYIYFSYILIHIHSHHFSPFLLYFTLKYPVYFSIFIEIQNTKFFHLQQMEFLKHEVNLFQEHDEQEESGIVRSAEHMLSNPIYQEEQDVVTRQRLLFGAILCDHSEMLFNGNANERGPLWEQLRLFMIEQGTTTLMDKDWKYVAGCYWQNIRKESIRRMAKMRVGTMKTARPGQLELDRLVGEIVNKRGPGSASLETLVQNYGRNYTDEEGNSSPSQQQETQQSERGRGRGGQTSAAEQIHHQIEGKRPSSLLSTSMGNSPAAAEEVHHSPQATLDQLVRNASNKILSAQQNNPQINHHHEHLQNQQHSHSHDAGPSMDVSISAIPVAVVSSTSSTHNSHHQFLPSSKLHPIQSLVDPQEGANGNISQSSQIGKMVAKTHSQLMSAGFTDMAAEFEQQLRQMVNGCKAWMFDQLFQQQDDSAAEDNGIDGPTVSPKRLKH